jgi:hypothetical protein
MCIIGKRERLTVAQTELLGGGPTGAGAAVPVCRFTSQKKISHPISRATANVAQRTVTERVYASISC